MQLRPCAQRPSILSWLSDGAADAVTVGHMLLPGMAAYARVLNPARRRDADIRWDQIGATPVDSTTQWPDLVAAERVAAGHVDPEDPWEPEMGTVDPAVADRLAQLLAARTTTPDECFFLVWEGYGALRPEVRTAATVDIAPSSRRMHILGGRLTDASESIETPPFRRSPMWWIPSDGAWCVGNDIYGRSVFVGGSAETIAAVVADPRLEAYVADANQPLANEVY
jgi:hypothetical protein